MQASRKRRLDAVRHRKKQIYLNAPDAIAVVSVFSPKGDDRASEDRTKYLLGADFYGEIRRIFDRTLELYALLSRDSCETPRGIEELLLLRPFRRLREVLISIGRDLPFREDSLSLAGWEGRYYFLYCRYDEIDIDYAHLRSLERIFPDRATELYGKALFYAIREYQAEVYKELAEL